MTGEDQIIGIAVLGGWLADAPGCEVLHVLCASPGRRFVEMASIRVYRRGEPKAPAPSWQYEEDGDWLNVSPSVNWLDGQGGSVFHNGGQWRVRFVRRQFDVARDHADEVNRDLREGLKIEWGLIQRIG